MPITRFENKNELSQSEIDGLVLVLNNGDRAALANVIERWNFADEVSFFKFVLAAMIKAEGEKIFIQVGGNVTGLSPNETLLRPRG